MRCKQNFKNETKQSGPKSEYVLNQTRSGALFFKASLVEIRRWVTKIVYIIGCRSRSSEKSKRAAAELRSKRVKAEGGSLKL